MNVAPFSSASHSTAARSPAGGNLFRIVRRKNFPPAVPGSALVPMYLELGRRLFPEAGAYRFEIYFTAGDKEVLKGEHPFYVLLSEE